MECGICQCPRQRTGRKCECLTFGSYNQTADEDESFCKDNSSEVCSGLGVCKCGVCDCNKRSNPNEACI